MEKEQLEYVLVPLGLLVYLTYHIWLVYTIVRNPLRTVIGLNAESRHQWVLFMMSDPLKNGVLAVQTIRNNIMACTLLSTTAITLSSLIGIFASGTWSSDDTAFIPYGRTSIKHISVTICFLVAFLCNVQSIRYYCHVSFLITAPTLRDKREYMEYIAVTLNRGSHAWSIGLRAFYLSFPFFLWIYGPIPMFACCCLTSLVLFFLDTTAKITRNLHSNSFRKERGTHDVESAVEPDYHPLPGNNLSQNSGVNHENVYLSGSLTSASMTNSMQYFLILKQFGIEAHPRKAPIIKQVHWQLPPPPWLKCNTDGAARGSPGLFIDDNAFFFWEAFNQLLLAVIIAIEMAMEKNWSVLWLETNSSLLVNAFKNPSSGPWSLFNCWKNCISLTNSFSFRILHIYREANACADSLASFGAHNLGFIWWDSPPSFISMELLRGSSSMQVQELDYVLVPLGLLVLGMYHIWLLCTIMRYPSRTVIGLNAQSRYQWDPLKNGVLGVQTIRNNIMASTLLATTAITLSSLIGILASNDSDRKLVYGNKTPLNSSIKRLSMSLCFLVAFLCNAQSIRYYAHVSFLITTPALKGKMNFIRYVAKTLNRDQVMSGAVE
ncbi:putative ribonuclease H protein [Glycine soja]